ncbi:hypothetical protein EVAR_41569_1 [Eumeta japonica]|uniref:Uncharacterized protein n=1 Tax=Eumeta variegata TaxID=151549 RepID=A0A4C1XXX2_EUMVA|nr:hypothetical protein EVAR_41569_1 [Eumeta japonica]
MSSQKTYVYTDSEGWFGEDRKCLESVELCCTMPAETTSELPPHPNTYKGCGYRNVNGLDVSITGGSVCV